MSAATNRLEGAAGLLLDRSQTISFEFDGKTYSGVEGDTIASALAANDVWMLSRSFKYHRPRGVLTMAGQDANTLVQLPDEPNVLADRHPISNGLKVTAQNVAGSLENDKDALMGAFSRFMPVGFYYRAFFKPKGVWEKYWEPIVRRKAGLGKVNLTTPHGYYDKAYGYYDVAVIGGGPAGMAAALRAAKAGGEVLLVEENPVLGGSLTYARFGADAGDAASKRAELIEKIEAQPNIEVMTAAVCNGWFGDNWLPVIRGNRMYKMRAKEVVFACGSLEQPAQFRNNDLPGVMMGSAAQRLIKLYGVRPGRRAVVLAGNDDGYGVALDLADAGVEVSAIVDLRDDPSPTEMSKAAAARGIKAITGHCVYEARGTRGNKRVRGASVRKIIARGQAEPMGQEIECDLLCLSVGYTPTYQLPLQSGAKLDYDDQTAMFSITGLRDHIALAGSQNGSFALDAVLAEGEHAGWQAAKSVGLKAGKEPAVPEDRGSRGVNHHWPIFKHPKGKDFVDFDEDLQVKDIINAVKDGYNELELVKRFSTVGMGPSQGRHSALVTARLVARETGRTVAETGVTTARPPFTGEKLGVLAGRSFDPERHTAMHHRHLEAGAQMMTAGLWWRPGYYGPKENRGQCIRDEVLAVRNNIGVIDVSTLGGLEIRGPDAAEFMNRMYTFAYLKQPVMRARYVLMTNDAGTIIDDGVACRFSEDHYYVTATTGGVDRVYQTMLWWNAQWRLNVDVANVTAAYAGVNVAGPKARDLLQELMPDVDFSAEAFPYMGLREGTIVGIPARLFRVGFVGELGCEIHVPASHGEAMWDAIIEAGQKYGLKPFGVEAQRVLRMEKGHIIVSQDTDAMTTPEEVDMTWAIAKKKPFFVGERSIQLRNKHLSKRKLVGFEITDPGAPIPQESNLVLRDGNMVGFVTSVVRSPSLEKIIGLAYTARDESAAGSPIRFKLDDGSMVGGKVVPPHFYDPENKRQEM